MKRFYMVLFVVALVFDPTAAFAVGSNGVWVWNPHCPKPIHVALKIRLDGKMLYTKSLPLCQWTRKFEAGKTSFKFTSHRKLIWRGYRSDHDQTAAGTVFTVYFWQAGGETDGIELGYSVASKNKLYMNSLHLLRPTKESKTVMAPGLVLETRPEKKR